MCLTSLPPSYPTPPKQYVGSFSVDDLDTQESVWLVQQELWALRVGELGRALPCWGPQPWGGVWEWLPRPSDPPASGPRDGAMRPREGQDRSHSEWWARPRPHPGSRISSLRQLAPVPRGWKPQVGDVGWPWLGGCLPGVIHTSMAPGGLLSRAQSPGTWGHLADQPAVTGTEAGLGRQGLRGDACLPPTLSHPGLSTTPGHHPEIQPSGPQDLQRGG